MDKEFNTQFKQENIGALFSFIAEGLIVFNSNGDIIFLNPHASLLLDYTTNELIGKKLDEIIPVYLEEKRLEKNKRIAITVLKKKIFTIPTGETLYFESQSGKKFPVFASAKLVDFTQEESGESMGVLVFRDITTEKELERYKKSTAKTLSELTPILQKTATGDFTFYPELPKEEDEFTELMVGMRLMLDDLRELDLAREKNEQEKIRALEEKRELTEKYSKELEQEVDKKTNELSGAKKHIETVIENLTSGLIEYDEDNHIIRLNKAAEDILGVKKDEIVGKKITKEDKNIVQLNSIALVTYPELAEKVKNVSRDVSGVDADISELTIIYPIERELQIAAVQVPISGMTHGRDLGTLKVVRDITREKLISRSKSEFISIAAHQLRTPLSAVKWALHLLISGDLGKVEASQLKIISEAFDTNEKIIGLVNDLLNVARIEDGRFGYEFKKDDFHDVVAQLIHTSKPRAKEKDISLFFKDNTNTALEFIFDQSKISLALQNLIDNAIKYTPKGGKVGVTLSYEKPYAKVDVTDNGVGIPEHQISRLFTKFFRAENVTRLPVAGSGLGLFIAHNVVARHGGSIQVQSKEGKGATFSITIPTDETLIPAKDDIAASLYI